MRLDPRLVLVFSALVTCTAGLAASCGDGTKVGGHATGSGAGGAGSGGGGNGGDVFNVDGGSCFSSADCDGGVCVGGMCCPSATDVCGSACCTGATVCLNEACVTPGKDCYTASDCGAGQYCETALGGSSDGGVGEAGVDGGVCTEGLPLAGKCLPLPPVCPGDAGVGDPDAGCVANCEYFPPIGGKLNAVPEWQWGPTAMNDPSFTDVWSTPVVGRVYDTNCDGVINELDAPVVIFVSGNDLDGYPAGTNCQTATVGGTSPSMCHTGALRMLDGNNGEEIWTLDHLPGSVGFAGTSVAIGDVDGDGNIEIVAATGEGDVVLLDAYGNVKRISNMPIPGDATVAFGWGGGLALADMDGDGFPEIAFGSTVYTTTGGAITLKFTGTAGLGGGSVTEALSTFVDLDLAANMHLELLAGNTAYTDTGTILWNRSVAGALGPALPDGFPGVGDFNMDGKPDVVIVGPQNVTAPPGQTGAWSNAFVWILNGATGSLLLGPVQLPTTAHQSDGGPPTVADFDGDGMPEIGVATADYYWMLKPNFTTKTIDIVWKVPNHDFSSSVTGSTVFDFEGQGHPSVIYADECFLWVYDGATGAVRFSAPHTSFTGTEASLVADVAGDGRAHLLMVSNGADPSSAGWGCLNAMGDPVTINGVTWAPSTLPNKSYRGLVSFGDSAHSWVGTRTLWNEHTYHVTNICDDTDDACGAPDVYGSIPKVETENWTLSWLNNFRQNVQDKGLFNAPDAVVSLTVSCSSPVVLTVSVRNIGIASLPANVAVGLSTVVGTNLTQVAQTATTQVLFPGQTQQLTVTIPANMASDANVFEANILNPATMPTFHECNTTNDSSGPVKAQCSE